MFADYFSGGGERLEISSDFHSFVAAQKGINYSRKVIIALFMENIQNCFSANSRINVALVGGSPGDPELSSLREMGFDYSLTTFGIEDSDEFLDLNVQSQLTNQFDLVICSQVLEHLWNSGVAIETLCGMVKPGGRLWISVPASNRKHASPEYFSAGYTSKFLVLNCAQHNLKVSFSIDFGSKREYAARHLLPIWLTERGHRAPLLFAFEGKSSIRRLVLSAIYLQTLIYLQLSSSKLFSNSKYSTETVYLAFKSV